MPSQFSPFGNSPKIFCVILMMILGMLILIERISPFVLPLSSYYFRPWEYMTGAHQHGLHKSNASVTMEANGDLSNMIRVKQFKNSREITHSMNKYGHRNSIEREYGEPDVVIVGNSFMAGAGNSDKETFAAKLREKTNLDVYAFVPENMSTYLSHEYFTEYPPKIVIWGRVERNINLGDAEMNNILKDTHCFLPTENEKKIAELKLAVKQLIKVPSQYMHLSVLKRSLHGLYQEIRFALTGRHHGQLMIGSDSKTLFFMKGVRLLKLNADERGMNQMTDAIRHASSCLSERGTTLVFLGIPDKPNIERDLVPTEMLLNDDPLTVLHSLLDESNIQSVHLLPAFRDAAAEGKTLYWADDTHWNPQGIGIAVEEVLPFVR